LSKKDRRFNGKIGQILVILPRFFLLAITLKLMKTASLEIPFGSPVKREEKPVKKAMVSPKIEKKATAVATKFPAPKPVDKDYALQECIRYFQGDELAANVWLSKYALRDTSGNVYETTPDDMHRRLSREIARIESNYVNPLTEEEIFDVLKNFRYIIPQGGPMTGIGNNFQYASLSNCFVIGFEGNADSYGGVMKVDEEQVQLMKRRGGVGHDLSAIRPSGAAVKNSALSATGIVPFMERYSNSTREVAQGGRRGALMLSLSVKHPEVEQFIEAKQDTSRITGANVSIRITDDFMKAVAANEVFKLQFPVDAAEPKVSTTKDAREIWEKIVHNAWRSAEPGILFWDTIINESVADSYASEGFKTVSTNPCGEIPLCPYDSCRLLAINLYSYVDNPFSEQATFNFFKFKKHVRMAQRIMDDIVDLEVEKIEGILDKIEKDPEPYELKRTEFKLWQKIKEKCIKGRRMGIGITAEGDMLAALGLRYGSEEAIERAVEIHKTLALEAYGNSVTLAKERGAFPLYDPVKEERSGFINRIKEESPDLYAEMQKYGRRNISLLTIAPTGTTSLMSQTTSGIEPVFRVSYKRRRKINPEDKNLKAAFVDKSGDAWEEFRVFHKHFVTWLEMNGYDVEQVKNMEEDELEKIVQASPYFNATANDVDWVSKVKMQGAIQKWVDHSISVTVNLPEDVNEELIGEIYMNAWKSGCKGITVYREGSRDGVLISDSAKKPAANAGFTEFKRPSILEADVLRFNNEHEKWIAVIGKKDGNPYEIFTGKAEEAFSLPGYVNSARIIKIKDQEKSRYDLQYNDRDGYEITIGGLSRAFEKEYWNYAKLISGILRHGMPIDKVVHVVNNLHLNEESLNTWKNGVVRVLSKYIPDGTQPRNNVCPECDQPGLIYEEGCLNCKNCGHTKCG